MKETLDLHLVQWRVIPGDLEGNLRKADELLARAGPGEGSLILFPEMFSSGFCYRDLPLMARRSGEVLGWMAETARGRRCALAGSFPTVSGGKVANTLTVVDERGVVRGAYDKIHLFPPTGEEEHFTPGKRTVTFSWAGVGLGLAVCFDLRFPEVGRRLLEGGASVMLVSSQWPLERLDQFRDFVRVRAMENQFFVAACNSCGEDGAGMVLGGGSMVAGPRGEILGVLGPGEGVLSLSVFPGEVRESREKFPVVESRRPDLF